MCSKKRSEDEIQGHQHTGDRGRRAINIFGKKTTQMYD